MENSSAVFVKFNPTHGLTSSLGYLPKKNENTCPQKGLHKDVHACLICNSQNLEATHVPIKRRMDKQITIYMHHGVQCGHEQRRRPDF